MLGCARPSRANSPSASALLLHLQIVAGLEPDHTNTFLQMLGRAAHMGPAADAVQVCIVAPAPNSSVAMGTSELKPPPRSNRCTGRCLKHHHQHTAWALQIQRLLTAGLVVCCCCCCRECWLTKQVHQPQHSHPQAPPTRSNQVGHRNWTSPAQVAGAQPPAEVPAAQYPAGSSRQPAVTSLPRHF